VVAIAMVPMGAEGRSWRPMTGVRFVGDEERVLYHARLEDAKVWITEGKDPPSMSELVTMRLFFQVVTFLFSTKTP